MTCAGIEKRDLPEVFKQFVEKYKSQFESSHVEFHPGPTRKFTWASLPKRIQQVNSNMNKKRLNRRVGLRGSLEQSFP